MSVNRKRRGITVAHSLYSLVTKNPHVAFEHDVCQKQKKKKPPNCKKITRYYMQRSTPTVNPDFWVHRSMQRNPTSSSVEGGHEKKPRTADRSTNRRVEYRTPSAYTLSFRADGASVPEFANLSLSLFLSLPHGSRSWRAAARRLSCAFPAP